MMKMPWLCTGFGKGREVTCVFNRSLILGIETSCDDTSAAVVLNGQTVLSNIISSQDSLHHRFGGIVPEIASRRHLEIINHVVDEAMAMAGVKFGDLTPLRFLMARGWSAPYW